MSLHTLYTSLKKWCDTKEHKDSIESKTPGTITIDQLSAVDLRVGTILAAEEVAGSDKLLKLKVDLGEERPRQVLSGIRHAYTPDDLIGHQYLFVTNLVSRMIMGQESQAMILAVSVEKGITLMQPGVYVAPGASLR